MKPKVFCYIIFVYLQLMNIAYAQKKDTIIVWSKSRPLTWSDFTTVKPNSKTEIIHGNITLIEALADTRISYNIGKCVNDTVPITCYSVFDKKKSVTVVKYETPECLVHMQKYFDLMEIHTRLFRKALMNKKFRFRHFNGQFKKLYAEALKKEEQEEALYDMETFYYKGTVEFINIEQQKHWDIKIADELKALDAYSNINVNVRLKHFLFF